MKSKATKQIKTSKTIKKKQESQVIRQAKQILQISILEMSQVRTITTRKIYNMQQKEMSTSQSSKQFFCKENVL